MGWKGGGRWVPGGGWGPGDRGTWTRFGTDCAPDPARASAPIPATPRSRPPPTRRGGPPCSPPLPGCATAGQPRLAPQPHPSRPDTHRLLDTLGRAPSANHARRPCRTSPAGRTRGSSPPPPSRSRHRPRRAEIQLDERSANQQITKSSHGHRAGSTTGTFRFQAAHWPKWSRKVFRSSHSHKNPSGVILASDPEPWEKSPSPALRSSPGFQSSGKSAGNAPFRPKARGQPTPGGAMRCFGVSRYDGRGPASSIASL